MKPPCIVLIEKIFPVVRVLAARQLAEQYGKTQKEIADGLNVSQATVSNYLKEKRNFDKDILEISEKIAKKVSFGLNEGFSDSELLELLCTTCFELRKDKELCAFHNIADLADCNVCPRLYTKNFSERNEVITLIERAADILGGMNLGQLIPEVQINIAMAVHAPQTPLEVAALPGRMIEVKGTLKRVSDPQFGASRHMAGILLSVMKISPGKRAAVNVRYDESLKDLLERHFTVFYARRKTSSNEELRSTIETEYRGEECIVDLGAFGIEPCLYVLGETAVEAVERLGEINEKRKERQK
jgi:hypothetical protein